MRVVIYLRRFKMIKLGMVRFKRPPEIKRRIYRVTFEEIRRRGAFKEIKSIDGEYK